MNFIHIADLHANRDRKDRCISVLKKIKDFAAELINPVVLFAGDFWDSAITNTEASGFTEYLEAVRDIALVSDVYMIAGTPSHEPSGALRVFSSVGAHVAESPSVFSLEKDGERCRILCLPEPRRGDFPSSSVSEQNQRMLESLRKPIDSFRESISPGEISVVMYHGEVTTAVYQNGVMAGTLPGSCALPVEWLKAINADYYALGHIHAPQEVFRNCWYSGSPCPVNFGETHEGGFNAVEIGKEKTRVKRILLGFPVNRTEDIKYESIDSIRRKDYRNMNVHLRIEIDRQLKKTFNVESLRRELLASTGASELRISFVYTVPSVIRSKEISAARSASDKFALYAQMSGISYGESIIGKIQEIEDSLLVSQFCPSESFELESLSLRGAIGIKDGTGRDEINIDFTKYDDGILAVVGPNGAGKTTLLENCHPYPQMLTRGGSLKDHFFLKDSHRILVYKTSGGRLIRISMLIDGAAKCIGTIYSVEEKKAGFELWEPLRQISGYEGYKEWVEHTFGPVDMFIRTSFYSKEQSKSVPDLARATKSEKMDFFSALAGTEYLSEISSQAKSKCKEESAAIDTVKSIVKNYDGIKSAIKEAETVIDKDSSELETVKSQIEQDKAELDSFRKKQRAYDSAAGSAELMREKIKAKSETEDTLSRRLAQLEEDKSSIGDIVNHKDEYKAQLDWYNENIQKRDALKGQIQRKKDSVFNKRCLLSETEALELSLRREKIEAEKEASMHRIRAEALLASDAQPDGNCPVCGAPLSEHKRKELEKEAERKRQEAAEHKRKEAEALSLAEEKESRLSMIDTDSARKEITEAENEIYAMDSDVQAIDQYIDSLNLDEIHYAVEKAEDDYKSVLIEKKEVSVKLAEAREELKKLSDSLKAQPEDFSDKIRRLERGIVDTEERRSALDAEISFYRKNLDKYSSMSKDIEAAEAKMKEHERNIREYSVIEKAFGNNGIQSLELDSAAPEISDITNSILKETYGDRFSLSFETQRDTSDGRRIDDFNINVFDSRSGRLKRLDMLCSGEAVWIKQALCYAFSVLRARRTGFCFRTRFLDESDGSLDSESRMKYVGMIEAAHRACNARLTLLITHSQEIKDIARQKLVLAPL